MPDTNRDFFQHQLAALLQGENKIHLVGPLPCDFPASWDGPVICVDGGAEHPEARTSAVAWVGDGDSSTRYQEAIHGPRWKLSPEKDISDLAAALSVLPMGALELELWGFLGGRQDHQWANFGEIHRFLKQRPNARAAFLGANDPIQGLGPGRHQMGIEGRFSLLLVEGCQVRMRGDCQYPIDPPRMVSALSSLGISNRAQGKIELHCAGPVFIFLEAP